jgi:hypothetical protein
MSADMVDREPRHPLHRMRTRPALLAADVAAAAWVLAWIVVAVLVGIDISQLNGLSTTLSLAGGVLVTLGHGLHVLSHLPFVGHGAGSIGGRLVATGTRAATTSKEVSTSIHQLSYLLPIVVAVAPTMPVLAVYLPVRIQRDRDLRAVRRALREPQARHHLERYLARRAVTMLPFHQVRRLSADPWEDVETGRVRHLAEAELRRLGIDPHFELGPPDAADRS